MKTINKLAVAAVNSRNLRPLSSLKPLRAFAPVPINNYSLNP
jgi:hypothetical protein